MLWLTIEFLTSLLPKFFSDPCHPRESAANLPWRACCLPFRFLKLWRVSKANMIGGKMKQALALALRERAVSALQTSTTMLKVAQTLSKQGNQTEAARLRNEARYKRNESILLMDEARAVEQHTSNIVRFPERKPASASSDRDRSMNREIPRVRTG
jgi:hypothetical protein